MRYIIVLVMCALALGPVPLTAQATVSASSLQKGDRIRFSTPDSLGARTRGKIVNIDQDTLWVWSEGREISLLVDQIEGLQVSRGRRRFLPGLLGFGAGFLGGATVGGVVGGQQGEFVDVQSENAYYYSVIGAMIGAPAGALVGAMIGSERWESVGVRPHVEAGAAGASLSISFLIR